MALNISPADNNRRRNAAIRAHVLLSFGFISRRGARRQRLQPRKLARGGGEPFRLARSRDGQIRLACESRDRFLRCAAPKGRADRRSTIDDRRTILSKVRISHATCDYPGSISIFRDLSFARVTTERGRARTRSARKPRSRAIDRSIVGEAEERGERCVPRAERRRSASCRARGSRRANDNGKRHNSRAAVNYRVRSAL